MKWIGGGGSYLLYLPYLLRLRQLPIQLFARSKASKASKATKASTKKKKQTHFALAVAHTAEHAARVELKLALRASPRLKEDLRDVWVQPHRLQHLRYRRLLSRLRRLLRRSCSPFCVSFWHLFFWYK
jgi:hypothetical protein